MAIATHVLGAVEQENLEKARAGYEAFKRGDIAAVLAQMAEEIEWVPSAAPEIPYSGVRHGKTELQKWFADLGAIDYQVFEPVEYVAQGDTVVVLVHSEGTMRHNGAKLVDNPVHFLTYRDGQCVRFRIFADTAAHLAAWRGEPL